MSRGNKAGNSHRTPGTCAANKKARVKFIFIFPFSSHYVIHSPPADSTLHISNSKSRLKILPHPTLLLLCHLGTFFANYLDHPDGLACSIEDDLIQFKLSEQLKWVGLMQRGQSTTTISFFANHISHPEFRIGIQVALLQRAWFSALSPICKGFWSCQRAGLPTYLPTSVVTFLRSVRASWNTFVR